MSRNLPPSECSYQSNKEPHGKRGLKPPPGSNRCHPPILLLECWRRRADRRFKKIQNLIRTLRMFRFQLKSSYHTMRQEDLNFNRKKKETMYANSKVTELLELSDKDFKAACS